MVALKNWEVGELVIENRWCGLQITNLPSYPITNFFVILR
jgi:hypothetical protein